MSAWIPLMDYATKKNVSISTLRRYIKSGKIKYKTEGGKYLLWDDEMSAQYVTPSKTLFTMDIPSSSEEAVQQSKIIKLESSLQKAREEIAELKMLVSIYEEQFSNRSRSP